MTFSHREQRKKTMEAANDTRCVGSETHRERSYREAEKTRSLKLEPREATVVLIFCTFHICEFTYSLTFICNPQISTCGACAVICRHEQNGEKI